MPDLIEMFTLTTDAVAMIVETGSDPRAETPCGDWNYAQLLGHLVGGDRLFAGILTGTAKPPAGPRMAPDPDLPPPSASDYRDGVDRLTSLLSEDSIKSGTFQAPVGEITGLQVTILRSVEHFLHGWDLAKSSGASTTGLEPAAEALNGPARQLLGAVGETTIARRRPFGDPVPLEAGASGLDQLVAAFGRDPSWAPAAGSLG